MRFCLASRAQRVSPSQAMAPGLAGAGASVALADIDEQAAAQASGELSADGFDCSHVRVDVTCASSVDTMVDSLLQRWDSIDILVNNAGICRTSTADDMSLEDWDAVSRLNHTPFQEFFQM